MNDPFKPLHTGKPPPREQEWTPIVPVPADAPPPPTRHPTLGEPTDVHTYVAATGETNGFVWRFDRHGGKEFRPLTFCLHPGGFFRDWRWQTWAKPRPLFNLDRLHNRPASPVLVVEGERSCRAGEQLAPGYVSVTSPGGSKAASQADWKPLARVRSSSGPTTTSRAGFTLVPSPSMPLLQAPPASRSSNRQLACPPRGTRMTRWFPVSMRARPCD
jgi:putative DNA primase/helicase